MHSEPASAAWLERISSSASSPIGTSAISRSTGRYVRCNVPVRILAHSAGAYRYAQFARNAVSQGRGCSASQDQELVVQTRLRRIVWTPRDHPARYAALLTGQIEPQLRQATLMGVTFSPTGLG